MCATKLDCFIGQFCSFREIKKNEEKTFNRRLLGNDINIFNWRTLSITTRNRNLIRYEEFDLMT